MQNHVLLPLTSLSASEYSCGAYGAGSYDTNSCTTTATDGALAFTGSPFFVPAAIGVVVIVVAVVVAIVLMRKNRKK